MLSLSPVAESATLLRRIGVVVGSVLVTLGYCLDVLWRAAFRRLDRARVDRYTRGWASKLLRPPTSFRCSRGKPLFRTAGATVLIPTTAIATEVRESTSEGQTRRTMVSLVISHVDGWSAYAATIHPSKLRCIRAWPHVMPSVTELMEFLPRPLYRFRAIGRGRVVSC